MKFIEEKGDLFSVPSDYYLAHCISSDFALGAGIAVQFDKRYNMRERLKNEDCTCHIGNVVLVDNVFNLITKKHCHLKPTYHSLEQAIITMKNIMYEMGVTKLAIPKIGCGLDKLEWEKVREILISNFMDTDVEILVRYL